MKKKILLPLLAVVSIFCFCFGLAACGESSEPPKDDTPKDDPPQTYSVTVSSGEGFAVNGLKESYAAKDTVTFTVEVSDSEKETDTVKADEQTLTPQSDGHYEFVMPEKDVVVSVTLKYKTPAISVSTETVSLNLQGEASVEVQATLTPNVGEHEFLWASVDDSVATVTADGATATIHGIGVGSTTVTVSLSDSLATSPVSIAVTVQNFRPWTEEEESVMKEHLHGVVLEPTAKSEMHAAWDETAGQITIEGDYVEGNELAEYAASYTAENGWKDVSSLYSVQAGTAYIFEKEVTTSDGARYVRVFIYAIADGDGDLGLEGEFYITSYDPYVYAWPTELIKNTAEYFLSDVTVPAVQSQHYFLFDDGVAAYFDSSEEDGGYGALLTAEGFTVEKVGSYYRALSPDGLFCLTYMYQNGELEIIFTYPLTAQWPVGPIQKFFEHYQPQGATAFDIPVFDGQGISFMYRDGYYNSYKLDDPSKYLELYGTVTVLDSSAELTAAYGTKLKESGWTEVGENTGHYQKQVGEKFARIEVSFDEENGYTLIDVYYVLREDATKGWQAAVASALGKYVTDTIPAYEGTIVAFAVEGDSIYVTVPEDEDLTTVKDNYAQTLLAANYTTTGSAWLLRYCSPNNQIKLTLSTTSSWSSHPNSLCIVFEEMPSAWNDARIQELLGSIGSTVTSLPKFEASRSFLCEYGTTATSFTLELTWSDDGDSDITDADLQGYVKLFEESADWTKQEGSTAKFTAADGTVVTITVKYGDTLVITVSKPAA